MKLREQPSGVCVCVCVLFSHANRRMDANNKTSNNYLNCESAYNFSSVKVPRNAISFIVQRNTAAQELHDKSNTNISSPHNAVRASTSLPKHGWRLRHRTNRFLPSVT
jgi:hypothetical protein